MRTFESLNKKQPKPKKCKVCENEFMPRATTQVICSSKCAIKNAELKVIAKANKQARKEKKMWHDKNDKLSVFEKRLEVEINAIARLIDYGCNCISCNPNTPIKREFGGHFHSVKSNNSIRFNLFNISTQCYSCNGEKGGNQIAYYNGLKYYYGNKLADYVMYDIVRLYPTMKWSRDELMEWIKKAKKIRKSLESNLQVLTPTQRIQLRNEINTELGIYKNEF